MLAFWKLASELHSPTAEIVGDGSIAELIAVPQASMSNLVPPRSEAW